MRDGLRPQARYRSVGEGGGRREKMLPVDPLVCYLFSNHTLVLLPHLPTSLHAVVFPLPHLPKLLASAGLADENLNLHY